MEEQELKPMDDTLNEEEKNKIVNDIVDKWNIVIGNFQNTTIQLCLMINDMIKDYPEETIKDLLKRVKQHPNIKKFVSIDRIWQGMRLVKQRQDLIQYHHLPEQEKQKLPEEKKPYLKKDGEVFWEFYFELAKQPISQNRIITLEQMGKQEKWSFRDLREHIRMEKEEEASPLGYAAKRKEKAELIKIIIARCRELPVEQLRGVSNFCKELLQDRIEGKQDGKENHS